MVIAFNAFASGNFSRVRELLNSFTPERDSSLWLPWSFLWKRLADNEPARIDCGEEVDCWEKAPDTMCFAVGLRSGELLFIDENKRKTLVTKIDKYSSRWREVAFSPDGSHLLAAFESPTENSRGRVKSFALQSHPDGRKGFVESADFHHEFEIWDVIGLNHSNLAASIDRSGQLKTWDLTTGEERRSYQTSHYSRCGLSCATGERYIVSYGWDGRVLFHDIEASERVFEIQYGDRVLDVSFLPDEKSVIICGYLGPQIWRIDQEVPELVRALAWTRTAACAISEDGQQLVTAQTDAFTFSVQDLISGNTTARFVPDNLAVPFEEQRSIGIGKVRLFESQVICAVGSAICFFRIPKEGQDWIRSSSFWYAPFAVSTARTVAICPGSNGTVRLWDFESGRNWSIGLQGSGSITALAISYDARLVAVATTQNFDTVDEIETSVPASQIEIWTSEGVHTHSIKIESGQIWSLNFSPSDSSLLAAAGRRNSVHLIDAETGSHSCLSSYSLIDGRENTSELFACRILFGMLRSTRSHDAYSSQRWIIKFSNGIIE